MQWNVFKEINIANARYLLDLTTSFIPLVYNLAVAFRKISRPIVELNATKSNERDTLKNSDLSDHGGS